MMAYIYTGGSRGKAPIILNLGDRWRWVSDIRENNQRDALFLINLFQLNYPLHVSNKQVHHQEVISVHAAYSILSCIYVSLAVDRMWLDTHRYMIKYCMLRVQKWPPDDEQLFDCNMYRIFFDVLLTVHLSIFISVINQLDTQNFVLQ